MPPLPQYQVDQSTVAQYYCTIPPVYNYSHYSTIEKAENGTIFEERTPYMNNLTTKAPRGIKTDDHMFEYFKAEEADILLQMRLLDQYSQDFKNLKKKLDYIQEIISTFMQKKNPKMNLDLVHYGELPFMADVEQILKQEARELYFKKKIQENDDNSFKYFQNKLVITDPYNPQDGFYLTFEFLNWIPEEMGKVYIKYGFSKRHLSYIPYRQTKEYIPEPNPISKYNTTCFFGNQDFVKGIKPDKDELLYIEVWYTNQGELPQKWRLFGWSLHEIFDPMGVFNGGAFKVPLYDPILFLPEHFPPSYTIDPFSEHYFVPKLHLKNKDKTAIESALKNKQVTEERIKEIQSIKRIPHSKHEGQVGEYEDILDQYSRPNTQSRSNTQQELEEEKDNEKEQDNNEPESDKLWGYKYNYNKADTNKMITTLTKKLNKHYINSLVNPNQVQEYLNSPSTAYNKSQLANSFLEKTLDQQIKELLPQHLFKLQEGKFEPLTSDGIHFKITKLSNIEQNLDAFINIKGALIIDYTIVQDAAKEPCVVALQTRVKKLLNSSYDVEFAHTFQTKNNDVLSELSFHNYQNAIILVTLFNERGQPIGWMHVPVLKLNQKLISLNTGKFRVRLCKLPVLQPPLNLNRIIYSNIVVEYQLMEGNLIPTVEEQKVQIDPEIIKKQQEELAQSQMNKTNPQDEQNPSILVQNQQQQQAKDDNPNESSLMKDNKQSTMINPNSSIVDESQNKTGIVDQILNKSILDNPKPLKPVSVFMDGLVNVQEKYPITFKVSLLKDSIIYSDDNKAKVSFQWSKYKIKNDDGDILMQEEVIIDIDMKKFVEKNKKYLDKYYIVIHILDSKLNLLYWHFTPLFNKDDQLNIEDFQVKLYKPPFQVPTRVNYPKLVESETICKYGIGYTDYLNM